MNLTSHNAPPALRAMQLAAVLGIGGVLLSGCTTPQPPAPAAPVAPVAAIETAPAVEPVAPAQPVEVAPPPVAAEPAKVAPAASMPETAGRLKIRVESVPAGATIVVNGRPVGHAPVVVEIDSVNNGFFREPVTIRARFIASDAAGESFSVDEELGPRERVPIALVFSRDGTQRVIRRY